MGGPPVQGMAMSRRREGYCWALVGLAGLALVEAQSAWPHTTGAHIGVTAQVAAVTRIEDLQQPSALTVSPADAARGYVTARATLKVRSNSVGGYTLTLWPSASWFDSVRVDGVGAPAELPGDGGALVRQTHGSAIDEVSLELTFRLREGTPAGEYAWPVAFEVSPL